MVGIDEANWAIFQCAISIWRACTVEIAAFNEFAMLLTNETYTKQYDTIVFDNSNKLK